MNKDLEAKIEERKKDAMERRGIASKASSIACNYGTFKSGLDEGRASEKSLFKNQDFIIGSYSLWSSNIKDGGYDTNVYIVDLKSNGCPTVFIQKNSEVEIYIPNISNWLDRFVNLYNQLCVEPEKEEAKKKVESEETEIRRRFGL